MPKYRKLGYILYGLSFIAPNWDFKFIGIWLAIDAASAGALNLILSWNNVLAGSIGLLALVSNFSIIPDNGMTKPWRIATIIFIWLLAFLPYSRYPDSFVILAMLPPYLIWASGLTLVNLSHIKAKPQAPAEHS
ncbi:MAG: hypothetical protein AAGB46_07730 [Verrucomicrobiota bacterium]